MSVATNDALTVTVFQKSTATVGFTLTNPDGSAYDLTGLRVYLTVWNPSTGDVEFKRFSPGDGLTIDAPATLGTFTYTPAAELVTIEARDFRYEIAIDNGAGADFDVVPESSGQVFRVCPTKTEAEP